MAGSRPAMTEEWTAADESVRRAVGIIPGDETAGPLAAPRSSWRAKHAAGLVPIGANIARHPGETRRNPTARPSRVRFAPLVGPGTPAARTDPTRPLALPRSDVLRLAQSHVSRHNVPPPPAYVSAYGIRSGGRLRSASTSLPITTRKDVGADRRRHDDGAVAGASAVSAPGIIFPVALGASSVALGVQSLACFLACLVSPPAPPSRNAGNETMVIPALPERLR